MPSYIELNKQSSFPSASNNGKAILGVDSTNQLTLTDSAGNSTVVSTGKNYLSYVAQLKRPDSVAIYSGALIIGEIYTITDYYYDDDFSNVADVISGTINSNGCVFIATGRMPNIWTNSTELTPKGNAIATILENDLGSTPTNIYYPPGSIYQILNLSQSVDYDKLVCFAFNGNVNVKSIKVNRLDLSFLDYTFNVGDGFNYGAYFDGNVRAIVRQSNGKIICGGDFTTYNGESCPYIVRLNADGTIDRSFNVGGGFNGAIYSLAIQSNGKIICGGNAFTTYSGGGTPVSICRLNTDGTLDTTFNNGGTGFDECSIYSIAIQADGKILAGGNFTSYNDVTNGTTNMTGIIRLNTDGKYDTTFNNGQVGFTYDGQVVIWTVKIQSDGKILCGGDIFEYTDSNDIYISYYIARLNTDGTFDTSFLNGNGRGFNGTVNTIDIQSTGKIICGGGFYKHSDNGMSSDSFDYIARLNTDGTSDTTFTSYDNGFNSTVYTLAVQPNDFIMVGGDFTSYNGDGGVTYMIQLQSDGNANNYRACDDRVFALCLQPDGKTIMGGQFTTYDGNTTYSIARMKGDLNIDTISDFGEGFNDPVLSTLIQPDGKILIGGIFNGYNNSFNIGHLVRLNTDGKVDTTFNTGIDTIGISDVGFNSDVRSLALQSDGKIVVGGEFSRYNGNIIATYIARLDATGSLDTTFNNNAGTGFNNPVYTHAIQSDGKILVGGQCSKYNGDTSTPNYLCRLNADGTIDTTFNYGNAGFNGYIYAIAIQSDGKILVGGGFDAYNGSGISYGITRLNSNGTLDTTFNTNAGVGFDSAVATVVIQSDGKIVVGGDFGGYEDINNAYTSNYIARLNSDGTFDTTFASRNGAENGFDNTVYTIAIDSDDNIMVGGKFADYNTTSLSKIARLDKDGNLLNDFISSGGGAFDQSVNTISLAADKKVIVGGQFSTYDGEGGYGISRIYTGYDIVADTLDQDENVPIEIRLYN